jgi:hypothetical protein
MVKTYPIEVPRLRRPGVALLAGGLLLAHLPTSVGLPCPLRTLTGVPCPFCGMTTSVRDTMGGHVRSALGAAPLGIVAVVIAVFVVLGVGPKAIRLPTVGLVAIIAFEWIFELARFHVLPT